MASTYLWSLVNSNSSDNLWHCNILDAEEPKFSKLELHKSEEDPKNLKLAQLVVSDSGLGFPYTLLVKHESLKIISLAFDRVSQPDSLKFISVVRNEIIGNSYARIFQNSIVVQDHCMSLFPPTVCLILSPPNISTSSPPSDQLDGKGS